MSLAIISTHGSLLFCYRRLCLTQSPLDGANFVSKLQIIHQGGKAVTRSSWKYNTVNARLPAAAAAAARHA
jgi:hypothetical protein